MDLELIYKNDDALFECPVYDEKNNFLYFVSIMQNRIYQLDCDTNNIKVFATNSNVGCIALLENNQLLEAEADGIFKIDTKTNKKSFITHIIENKEMRYNDGKFDSCGRFLVGTKGISDDYNGYGGLYSVNINANEVKTLVNNTKIANGLSFSKDDKYLYFIDTPTKKIGKYSYDIKTGNADFIEYIFDTKDLGYPDGMCIDPDGNLWVALWQGHSVININPETKQLIKKIELPCTNVTSCCLAKDYLYVTTAKDLPSDKLGSCLFRIRLSD